ncbi:MAG: DUF58 domain-containing protein [Bacteroidota bacterium]|nr:DUF58 domain-containing protein [Bacteroidota bacterium]
MEVSDLIKKVRKIEIKTRGLSKNIFAGEYHSAFKGRGMTFSEVREYQYGDDIRNIDWNVTARFNHPFIKIYEEERELTVMLLVDVSNSRVFGTQSQLKKNLITEIAAVLSFSAIQNNDKIGVILFSDRVEKFIPPKKGRTHILRIIRELIEYTPEHKETNISEALRYLTNAIKKRSTAFIISDFMDENNQTGMPRFDEAIRIANRKHDVIGLKIYDEREKVLPPVGLIRMRDAETGEYAWVDTSSPKLRNQYANWYKTMDSNVNTILMKAGVDYVSIATGQDYVKPLINLFKKR